MSRNNNYEKSNFFRRITRILIDPTVVRVSVIINLVTFLPGLIVCVLIADSFGPQGYELWDNFISDLGSINYTPVPFIFNFIVMVAGIFTFPAYLYNNKFLLEGVKENVFDSELKIWKRLYYFIIGICAILGYFFLLVGSIGMFGIGIFSIDGSSEIHFFFSVLVFAGLIFGALFAGIAVFLKKVICPHYIGLYMIFGPFIAGFLYLNPPFSISVQFLEWIMLFAQQIWLIPAAFFTLNHIRKTKPLEN